MSYFLLRPVFKLICTVPSKHIFDKSHSKHVFDKSQSVCSYSAFAELGGSTRRTEVQEETPVNLLLCDLCGYKASDSSNFHRHKNKRLNELVDRWTGGQMPQYRCEKCSPPFATSVKRKLKRHYMTQAHRETLLRERQEENGEALLKNEMQEKIINNNTVAPDDSEAQKVEATVEFKRFENVT